jgi:hypothetical protein
METTPRRKRVRDCGCSDETRLGRGGSEEVHTCGFAVLPDFTITEAFNAGGGRNACRSGFCS